MSEPKLNIKEETSAKKTRSPPKKAKVEQTVPKKKKLKTDADKAAEKAQHLRFGKAELSPDELSRLSKAQKREMYAAHAARSAVHHEVDQYEDENVGVQALSEGEKAAGNVRDISKSRYARKLKKKAKMQGKKGSKTAKSSASEPTAAQDAGASGTGEGGSNWLSRWKQRQEIHKSYYAAARSGTAAQTAGGKAASNGASAARSSMEQAVEKGKTAVSTAVKGLANAAKSNAHVLVIVGVFLLLMQQKWNQNFDGEPMTDIPQKFLNAGCDVYMVMQLRHDEKILDERFASMRELNRRGKTPDPEHYEVTYYADLPAMWQDVPDNEVLEELFQMFNLSRPQDFEGHSLSVSDVIALKRNGEVSVHYVDSIGFKDLQGFLDKQPERHSVLMNLKEKCDAPECNPTVCRKARDEHEL